MKITAAGPTPFGASPWRGDPWLRMSCGIEEAMRGLDVAVAEAVAMGAPVRMRYVGPGPLHGKTFPTTWQGVLADRRTGEWDCSLYACVDPSSNVWDETTYSRQPIDWWERP